MPYTDEQVVRLPEREWRREVMRRIDINTEITADGQEEAGKEFKKINEQLGEMTGILQTIKGGLKFLGWLGAIAKWITIMVAGFTAVIGLFVATSKLPEAVVLLQKWRSGK